MASEHPKTVDALAEKHAQAQEESVELHDMILEFLNSCLHAGVTDLGLSEAVGMSKEQVVPSVPALPLDVSSCRRCHET